MTAAAEPGVTLAWDMNAQLGEVAALLEATAEWGAYELAGQTTAPLPVAYWLIDVALLIARAARGEAVTI